ncbi:MAG: penicillin acylase family protein [Planctomycetia bacterium]|nr:penicillin acylase family protein [Planctomycetia bacterium]
MKPLRIKNPRRRFAAARDENGVPHVTAGSLRGALYGLGFMHAVDRPTQMLFAHAVASGRSAERIADKPELFEADKFFRKVGLYLHLDREVNQLDDDTFGHLTAYCEGVNDGMKQYGRSLPMWATGFQLHPWNQQAAMLIGNLLNFGGLAVGQQQNERILLELIQTGIERDKLCELFEPLLDSADFELLSKIKIANRLSNEALELLTDLPRLAGSNAWAVAPSRSATGAALLASDPHLEVNRLPALWYEAVLEWDEDFVMGATLPGCPFFAVARTSRVAWGVTYLKGDTSDYFIEDCRRDPEQGWQYRRGERWLNFEVREEKILRKGAPPESLNVYHNATGTLDADPNDLGDGYQLSAAWTGDVEGAGRSFQTWLSLIDCADALSAMDLVRECPQPTLCWVFADRAGHIGRQANGQFPRRARGYNGLLPIPAWDEANHWQGWIPTSLLPRVYDPPEGFVSSANEDVRGDDGACLVTLPVPDYRKRRIDERLAAIDRATIEDMQSLQYDVISLQARDLLAVFLPELPDGALKERLAAWTHSYDPKSLEATLFSRLYRNVLLEVFGQDTGQHRGLGWRRMLYLCSRVGFAMPVVTSIDRLLKKPDSRWWAGRDKGQLIRKAAAALAAEKEQPWSATNAFHFTNRFFEGQLVGRTLGLHTAELPMPGCHATPFQGHLLRAATRETTFAPSYHFVTDLGTFEAWTNLPGGASESWFSRWYKNDIPRWCAGKYKRLAAEGRD